LKEQKKLEKEKEREQLEIQKKEDKN